MEGVPSQWDSLPGSAIPFLAYQPLIPATPESLLLCVDGSAGHKGGVRVALLGICRRFF